MKSFRTIAILAVTLAALGALATWDEWQTKKDEEEAKTKNRLVRFDPEKATEVVYFRAQGDEASEVDAGDEQAATTKQTETIEVRLVKQDGVWRVTSPIAAKADENSIESFLKTLAEYDYSEVVTESKDRWADFGVKDPKRKVTVRYEGDEPGEFTLVIGAKAPVGYSVYTRLEGSDKVYIGSQYLLISTAKTLFDFRDKSVAKIESDKVKQVNYVRGDGNRPIELALTRDGEKWTVAEKGKTFPADAGEVRDFLDDISALKARAFIDSPAEGDKKIFDRPTWTISWTTEAGASQTLLVARQATKILAAFDPAQLVIELPDDTGGKLDKDLMAFRDKRVLSFDSSDVERVKIDGDEFVSIKGDWYPASVADQFDAEGNFKGDEKPGEAMHVRAFLVDLEFAKAADFLELNDPVAKGLGDKAPEHRITLTFKAEKQRAPLTVDLYPVENEKEYRYLRYEGAGYVYKVDDSLLESLKPSDTEANLDEELDGVPGDAGNG